MILFFNTSLCLAAVCLIIQSRREDTANFELYVAHQFSKSFFNNKVTRTNHSKCMWQVTSALCTCTRERKITYQFQFLSLRITSQYIFFHISIVPLIFILCLLQKLLFFPSTQAARLLLSKGSEVAEESTETGNQASSVSFETPKPVSFLQKINPSRTFSG